MIAFQVMGSQEEIHIKLEIVLRQLTGPDSAGGDPGSAAIIKDWKAPATYRGIYLVVRNPKVF